MLFLYNEVYFDIIDFEFNENENNFFVYFNNFTIYRFPKDFWIL